MFTSSATCQDFAETGYGALIMSYAETPVRHYHRDGTKPVTDAIFVFGSNFAGRHGKGAALVARQEYGAIPGAAHGLMGQSFAIPTKGYHLESLDLGTIARWVKSFCEFTYDRPDLRFFVTSVGCGLAGYSPQEIAPMFRTAINCSFPHHWRAWLED